MTLSSNGQIICPLSIFSTILVMWYNSTGSIARLSDPIIGAYNTIFHKFPPLDSCDIDSVSQQPTERNKTFSNTEIRVMRYFFFKTFVSNQQ